MNGIEEYAREMRAGVNAATRWNNRRRRWPQLSHGRLYRPIMRIMHHFGWCFPTSSDIEPGYVWCHWCGMRGSR